MWRKEKNKVGGGFTALNEVVATGKNERKTNKQKKKQKQTGKKGEGNIGIQPLPATTNTAACAVVKMLTCQLSSKGK